VRLTTVAQGRGPGFRSTLSRTLNLKRAKNGHGRRVTRDGLPPLIQSVRTCMSLSPPHRPSVGASTPAASWQATAVKLSTAKAQPWQPKAISDQVLAQPFCRLGHTLHYRGAAVRARVHASCDLAADLALVRNR
jgi:hypothetical protein